MVEERPGRSGDVSDCPFLGPFGEENELEIFRIGAVGFPSSVWWRNVGSGGWDKHNLLHFSVMRSFCCAEDVDSEARCNGSVMNQSDGEAASAVASQVRTITPLLYFLRSRFTRSPVSPPEDEDGFFPPPCIFSIPAAVRPDTRRVLFIATLLNPT